MLRYVKKLLRKKKLMLQKGIYQKGLSKIYENVVFNQNMFLPLLKACFYLSSKKNLKCFFFVGLTHVLSVTKHFWDVLLYKKS